MLVDVAAAAAISRATLRPVATASTSIQYLAAGRVGPLRATGTVLRSSEALGVVDVKVIDAGRDDRLLAAAHVTLRFLSGEDYVRQT
jgi:acyl-coenzyme A thioesterase PaaI-like protein